MKVAGIDISSEDKIIFPKKKITKGDMVNYYAEVAEKMLPFLKDRPLTLQRFPGGIKGQGFYQKNASDYFPDFIERIEIETEDDTNTQVICDNKKSLIYLVNQNTVVFHTWLSRKDMIDRPDKVIFDLDPPNDHFSEVKKAAWLVKDFLNEKNIEPDLYTTGKKGLHLSYKIRRTKDFDAVKAMAHEMAEEMEKKHPEVFTTQIRKNKREGKIFLDYLRNEYGQTAVCPYSLRNNEEGGIATPISWKKLDKIKSASEFHL